MFKTVVVLLSFFTMDVYSCQKYSYDKQLFLVSKLKPYLQRVDPIELQVPCGSNDSQHDFVNSFIDYYNSEISKKSMSLYLDLYGKKHDNGTYYMENQKVSRVNEYIKFLVDMFQQRSNQLMITSYFEDINPPRTFVINPDGSSNFE